MGRVVEVLGAIDDPGMEIEIAVRKFAVPHEFPSEVLTEAIQLPESVRPADLKQRVDLRDVPMVTIDGEDARDFDDAVYCEPIDKRRRKWRLIVAIADVSHYVTPGSAIDTEAQNRSTSVYFPRRVIPMLPEKLSNGLCSLNPAVDRLVMVADMVVGAEGEIGAYQFYPAVIHSHGRLTYTEVWDALSIPGSPAARRLAPLLPQLQDLYSLYKVLAKARVERGALDLETTETYIVCDPNGRIEKIVPRTRNDAHKIIEECMLAANVCSADLLERHKHPALYRIHEGPTPDRLANVRTLLKSLGLHLEGEDEPASSHYAELLRKIAGRPDQQLLQTVLLRSMQQAVYSPHNAGHFGLSYEAYTHFTSPIRRYPDLLVHRAIKAVLGKKGLRADDRRRRRRAAADAARQGGPACAAAAAQAGPAAARHGGVGKARPDLLGQRAPRRRCLARCRGLAEELLHARAGGRDLQRHRQRRGALRRVRRARRPVRRRAGARVRTGLRVLHLQRTDARAARRAHRPALPAGRSRYGASGSRRPRGATHRVPPGARAGAQGAAGGRRRGGRAQGQERRKGESVDERRARVARVQARKGRDIDKREKARGGTHRVRGRGKA